MASAETGGAATMERAIDWNFVFVAMRYEAVSKAMCKTARRF